MITFIDEHSAVYGVEPICRVLPIAPSTDHAHAARRQDPARLPARAKRDAALRIEIRRVFEENFQVYGVRKVWRQLKREGHTVPRCQVARLMRDLSRRSAERSEPSQRRSTTGPARPSAGRPQPRSSTSWNASALALES